MPSSERIVVADANVLLSALAQKAASKVFQAHIEIHTTEHTWAEVAEYLPYFGKRYGIPLELLDQAMDVMPIRVHARDFYNEKLKAARSYIELIDPEDVDVVALALKLEASIWSNDDHFKSLAIKRFTTAQLLKQLNL